MRFLKMAVVCLALASVSSGKSATSATAALNESSARLPVTRVILYKNGVGTNLHNPQSRHRSAGACDRASRASGMETY